MHHNQTIETSIRKQYCCDGQKNSKYVYFLLLLRVDKNYDSNKSIIILTSMFRNLSYDKKYVLERDDYLNRWDMIE